MSVYEFYTHELELIRLVDYDLFKEITQGELDDDVLTMLEDIKHYLDENFDPL